MKILVFGGTRYMGKHIINELLAKGHHVTMATRGRTADDFGNKVNRLIADRTDYFHMSKKLHGQAYDVVIDSLAYCSNDVKYLLDAVVCSRYIQISSVSVYSDFHEGMVEEEYDAGKTKLVYCSRDDFAYDEIKRQAECAVVQDYQELSSVRLRLPYVIGRDDYTKRLYFYVEHVMKGQPLYIDNPDAEIAFVRSDEAGRFAAFFAENSACGAVNGASPDTISVNEILEYVKLKSGKAPVLSKDGDPAPYNGTENYSLNTGRAESLGFLFTPLKSWIYELLDDYMAGL